MVDSFLRMILLSMFVKKQSMLYIYKLDFNLCLNQLYCISLEHWIVPKHSI